MKNEKKTYELPEVIELDTAMLFKGQETTGERSQVIPGDDWEHDDDI